MMLNDNLIRVDATNRHTDYYSMYVYTDLYVSVYLIY